MPPRKKNKPETGDKESKDSSEIRSRKNYVDDITRPMMDFINENLDHCYPTLQKKLDMVDKTGLSLTQVNNYFINARRRSVPKLRAERGLPPLVNPRRRKSNEGEFKKTRKVSAARKRKVCRPKATEDHSGHNLPVTMPDNSLPSGTPSPASTGCENDEVFLPDPPTQPQASSETDMLRKIARVPYQSDSAPLCFHTEEYQRQDGSASPHCGSVSPHSGSVSPHSVSSSQSSGSGLPLSPSHMDWEDSSCYLESRSKEEMEVAKTLAMMAGDLATC